ncbi:MAG TPA: calcium-binding protein, partial [Allosphingosinicella sp.]|nr:calcium-binding protein [Allosphingosinicella sp.]
MTIMLSTPDPADILTWGALPAGVTVGISDLEFQRVFTFAGAAAPAVYQTLLESFRYSSSSDTPPSQRSFQVSVRSAAIESATAYSQVYVAQTDDPGTAHDDEFFVSGTGQFSSNLGFDNGFGRDTDPDSVIEVVALNGLTYELNNWKTLASGALLFVGSFGGVSFDPNGAYSGPAVETFTYTLRGGSTATVRMFVAAPGAGAIQGTAGDDVLTSTAAGDILIGKEGNDTYFVDSVGDMVIERAGQGYDVLAASLSWTLTAGAYVELMTTGWIEGTAAINLAGNELDQQIWGNGAANIISGNDGDDTLFGFGGADTLVGNDGKDV